MTDSLGKGEKIDKSDTNVNLAAHFGKEREMHKAERKRIDNFEIKYVGERHTMKKHTHTHIYSERGTRLRILNLMPFNAIFLWKKQVNFNFEHIALA